MRIDKFLKMSRLIKRRTIANEVCEQERVLINGKIAKPSTTLKIGDVIEILFANNKVKVEVLSILIRQGENSSDIYKIIV